MATPYTPASSLLSPGRIGQAAWSLALAKRIRGFEANQISNEYHYLARGYGINPDLALAQACEETGWFTDHLWTERRNPCGLGITERGVLGKDYGSPANGILAHIDHLCCYVYTEDSCLADHDETPDPRHDFHDGNPRLSHLQEPPQGRRWAEKPGYVGRILAIANALLLTQEPSMDTPTAVTDRYIATLRSRGVVVTDLRGKLPVNANPSNRYGLVRGGLGGVTKLIQHWTGDSFNRATIKQIVGADYGGDTISERMSTVAEIALLRWYANYHIGKDGGTWGGIAYGTLVLPSGRVYVAWDIGTLTYHAFSVNGYSYALCCPASNGQVPTAAQLVALNQCWRALCEETPEIPAGWGDLYGHTEAQQFDVQNRTTCPGPALLAHVRKARATGVPSVTLPTQPGEGSVVEAPAARPVGFLPAGTADTFLWPEGEGVIIRRSVRYYNPEANGGKGGYYDREWDHATGYAPWQEVK